MLPAAGSVIASVAGSVLGKIFGGGDRAKAQRLLDEAYQLIDEIGAPPDLSRQIILDKFKQEGLYTPQLEQELDLAQSKVAQLQENPELRDTQMNALRALTQRSQAGLTPEDRAALNQVQKQVGTQVRGQEQSLLQELAARGQAGGGQELAARLAAGQAGADRASDASLNIAGMASRNALEAAARSGEMAGGIRGQDLDLALKRASAEDERNRMLYENSSALRARNIGAQNQAQMANLSERQRVSDINTGMGNQEKQRQSEAQRQYWLDKLGLAQTKAGAKQAQAGSYQKKAEGTEGTWQGIGGGVGAGFAQYGKDQRDQEEFDLAKSIAKKKYGVL